MTGILLSLKRIAMDCAESQDSGTSEGVTKAWETRRKNMPFSSRDKKLLLKKDRQQNDVTRENNEGFTDLEVSAFKTTSPIMNHRKTLTDAISAGVGNPSEMARMLSDVDKKLSAAGYKPDEFQAKYDKWMLQNNQYATDSGTSEGAKKGWETRASGSGFKWDGPITYGSPKWGDESQGIRDRVAAEIRRNRSFRGSNGGVDSCVTEDDGTSEGAKKGWETRKHGGAQSQTMQTYLSGGTMRDEDRQMDKHGWDLVDHLDESRPGWEDEIRRTQFYRQISDDVWDNYSGCYEENAEFEPTKIGDIYDKDDIRDAIGEHTLFRDPETKFTFEELKDVLADHFMVHYSSEIWPNERYSVGINWDDDRI